MQIEPADSDFAAIEQRLGLPLFVKPANEGSSIGISKVKRAGDLKTAYELAAKADPLVIAEQFVGGGEYTVGILDDQVLPVIRIVPAKEFYDYEAKYLRDDTQYLCPCGLSAEKEAQIQAEALRPGDVVISNARHLAALQEIASAVGDVRSGMEQGIPGDLLALDIRRALHFIGELTGKVYTDRDVLGKIFGSFCIGK